MIIFIVIVGLVFLILTHELGHFLAAKLFKVKVTEFGFGYPPKIIGKQIGETEYSLNALPFGGFVKIEGLAEDPEEAEKLSLASKQGIESEHSFNNQPAYKKAIIISAGVIMNFLVGWALLFIVFKFGIPTSLIITNVLPNSPASSANLQSGDKILNFTSNTDFLNFINSHLGQPTNLEILRNGKEINVAITPREKSIPGQGAIGIEYVQTGIPKEPIWPAIGDSLKQAFTLSFFIIQVFVQLVIGLFHGLLLNGVVGPIGVFSVAQQVGGLGVMFLVNMFALIALNLAVLNLLPLPALDGGHLLIILIEKIKGSEISYKAKAWVNQLGFAFLIILMILISVRDIIHLF